MTALMPFLKLQIALAKPGVFVLDQSRLDQDLLGAQTSDNNLFILDQSRLDVDMLATEGNDPNTQWIDVLDRTLGISIKRGADRTEVGSTYRTGVLNINLLGPSLDPHQNALIIPGVPVRLITNAGTVVIKGVIRRAQTSYEKPEGGKDGNVRVSLTVLDAGQRLANVMRYGVVGGTFAERVDELLSKHGIAYNRLGNGGGGNLARTEYESTLMNHLQLATDSVDGWYYVDRAGVVQVGSAGTAPTAPVMTFSSARSTDPAVLSYTDLNYSFDDGAIVNELTLTNRTYGLNDQGKEDGIDTDYVYRDATSVATYGTVKAGRETNLASTSDVNTLGQTLLTRYGRPANHVSSLTFVATKAVEAAAKLEPYQLVSVHFGNRYFTETALHKILNITHKIKGDQWLCTLELDRKD